MQIFKNRPLFCGLILFMTFSVICLPVIKEVKLVILALSLLGVALFILLGIFKKICSLTAVTASICCAFICLASLVSFVYFNIVYEENYGLDINSEHEIEAVVLSESYSAGASSEYEILVLKLDGKRTYFKANLECEYLGNITAANRIMGRFTIGEFEDKIGAYKEKDMMHAQGIIVSLISDTAEDLQIIKHNDKIISAQLARLNTYISNIIISKFGEDDGGVAASLLLGNPDVVPDDISRDFVRVGASHIFAISGTHMTILFGALAFILQQLFVPYKARAVILSFLSVFYLALTGFSMSATRSVLMLLMVYFSMICSYKADQLTSLSMAGAIILGFTPYAIFDAGFWMSFAATFGILVCMPSFQHITSYLFEPQFSKLRWLIKPILSIVTLILTSLCAIAPLIIVLCIFTKEISVYAILSSLVLGLPTEIMLMLTPLFLVFMKVPILGNVLYSIIKMCCMGTISYCKYFSLKNGALISLDYDFVTGFAIALGIILFICMFIKFKYKWTSFIPFVTAIVIFFSAIGIAYTQNCDKIRISYVNQADDRNIIIATNQKHTVLFDMTPGYYSSMNLAYEELGKMNVNEIDAYVLTNYTTAHISALSKSFQNQMIRKLYIPQPKDNNDYFRMVSVLDCARDNGVIVDFYEMDKDIEFISGMTVNIKRDFIDRSTAPVILLTMKIGANNVTYLSPSYNESELSGEVFEAIDRSDYLIFGSRGPTPKEKYKIISGERISEIIFSSNKVASYYDTSSFVMPDTRLLLSPEVRRYTFDKTLTK